MINVDIAIEAGDWAELDHLAALSTKVLRAAAVHLDEPLLPDSEVSLVFTDDVHIRALNARWRDQDKPTNVLSFAANEGGGPVTPLLGDVVLAFETLQREAHEQDKPFDDHLAHLLVHGFLHLLGYDHIGDEEAGTMEQREILILASVGISDPY